MSIEEIDGLQAWANLVANKEGKWPTRLKPDRLYPIAAPKSKPKFRISRSDRVFCIGSCFAREIEQALRRLQFDVLSIIRGLPQSDKRKGADAGMFNKYTVASIVNEVRWALSPTDEYSADRILIPNPDGLYEDYQLSGPNYPDELAAAKEFREAFNRSFALLKEADVLIVTLGLSEAWFDTETGLFLNIAPSRALVKKFPERFRLHVLDYEETLTKLEELYGLLKGRGKSGLKILMTVSPVPLLATFREQDVLVANAYSKAVLRAAVEKFQQGKEDVGYFPSYEFVTLSNPSTVWAEEDFRHVDRFFVEHIMGAVLEDYVEVTEEQRQSAALARAASLYRGKFFQEAVSVLKPLVDDAAAVVVPKIFLRWGMANRQLKNIDLAREGYRRYLELCPDDEKAREAFGKL